MTTTIPGSETQRVWLITGCSAGLGLLLAHAVHNHGDRVIATARDVASLSTLSEVAGIKTLQVDVTATQQELDAKVNEAMECFGQIDVLVNNAGYILSGVWEQINQESLYHQLDTNVFGPLRLTRSLLPFLRRQGGGSIVFIGSVAGWVGAGAGGPYSVSKFALEGAVECLQKEVAQFNIQAYIFALGQFRTNILEANRRKYIEDSEPLPEYKEMLQSQQERHEDTNGKQRGDPTRAANRIVEVVGGLEGFDKKDENSLPALQRVFLGPDCVNAVKTKCEETLKSINEHYDFFCGTDYPEEPQIQGYQ